MDLLALILTCEYPVFGLKSKYPKSEGGLYVPGPGVLCLIFPISGL